MDNSFISSSVRCIGYGAVVFVVVELANTTAVASFPIFGEGIAWELVDDPTKVGDSSTTIF